MANLLSSVPSGINHHPSHQHWPSSQSCDCLGERRSRGLICNCYIASRQPTFNRCFQWKSCPRARPYCFISFSSSDAGDIQRHTSREGEDMPLLGYDAKPAFLFQDTSSLVIEAWLFVLYNFMHRRHTTLYSIVIRIFFIKLLAQFFGGLLLAKSFGVWDGRITHTQYGEFYLLVYTNFYSMSGLTLQFPLLLILF